ncbi:CIC11C00000003008 [Sungouiella intermedia]|uniref:CIC11C00000003008 n=1 Tax=Sungouiella intermedia TaxID=45354 RepID=A0A1L0DGH2_9ASCO|nr:CIC11C00000003008 [[Candida] intermedia]
MDLSELSAGTPKVLDHYLELFLKSTLPQEMLHFRSAPVTPANYATHPDIQFFRLVKANHHYAYHKMKTSGLESSVDNINGRSTLFDPYSRELLLQRLRTFNALNWNIPPGSGEESLTELVCAAGGWACESIARNNNTKNHLKCTSCGHELVLRFNSVDQQPAYVPFQFDLEDINQLNNNLKLLYIEQIRTTGHVETCSWTKVHTPLAGVYYLTPYISETNEILIGNYLKCLRNLTDNLPILLEHSGSIRNLSPPISVDDLTRLVTVSNKWLLARYFHDNKENFSVILERMCPPWLHSLALMGWDLNIQTFSSQTVLLLVCTDCNQRVFIKQHGQQEQIQLPILSSSKILTPCKFPPHTAHLTIGFSTEFMDEMEEDEEIDPYYCHKPWCSHIQNVGDIPFFEYFKNMMYDLEKNIGRQGEYLSEKDQVLNMDGQVTKRRNSIDIDDGIERLTKLRKLYFVD